MKNKIILPGLIILIFAVSGCSTLSSKPSDSTAKEIVNLEVASLLKFPDVPTPSGFQLVAKESYTFQSGTFRVGLLRYTGKANLQQAVDFYRDQMPMYNWNLLNIIEHEISVLNLEKRDQTCVITLTPKGSRVVDILISIAPKPVTVAPASQTGRSKKSSEELVK